MVLYRHGEILVVQQVGCKNVITWEIVNFHVMEIVNISGGSSVG
jgi:hypothetical protein